MSPIRPVRPAIMAAIVMVASLPTSGDRETFLSARDSCFRENAMTQSDAQTSVTALTDVPARHLCLMQCLHEKLRVVDSRGRFDTGRLAELVEIAVSGADFEEYAECGRKMRNLELCEDYGPLVECLHRQ